MRDVGDVGLGYGDAGVLAEDAAGLLELRHGDEARVVFVEDAEDGLQGVLMAVQHLRHRHGALHTGKQDKTRC